MDFLEQREQLNFKVVNVASTMAAVNSKMQEINKLIMETNEQVRH